MFGSLLYTQRQAAGICSDEGTKRAAVNEMLAGLGCSDYECGTFCQDFYP